jgi:hypothetical protein
MTHDGRGRWMTIRTNTPNLLDNPPSD